MAEILYWRLERPGGLTPLGFKRVVDETGLHEFRWEAETGEWSPLAPSPIVEWQQSGDLDLYPTTEDDPVFAQ